MTDLREPVQAYKATQMGQGLHRSAPHLWVRIKVGGILQHQDPLSQTSRSLKKYFISNNADSGESDP